MARNDQQDKRLRAEIRALEKRREHIDTELDGVRSKMETLVERLACLYLGAPQEERQAFLSASGEEAARIVATAEHLERTLSADDLSARLVDAKEWFDASATDDEGNVSLPLTPVVGTPDQFTVNMPDGNRLVLTGQMPEDGGETAFEVRAAQPQATDHMPGCGLVGPFIEGQHPACSLCSGPLRLCGNNAQPYEGRACDSCQRKRVMPRRLAINALMGKLMNSTITPFAALEARDAVMAELMRPESQDALTGADFGNVAVMKSIAAAEIVAWDSGLERAAVRGAESFEGMPWDVKPCNHLLLLDGAMAVLLIVGESITHAVVVSTGGPRLPVKVMHTQIRRGQLITADRNFGGSQGAALMPGRFWHDMAALQHFMELEVVQRESSHLPRQATRAAMRAGKPLPKVIIVRLRRVYQEKGTGETEVEWQHRWMVRGHWRRQWYAKTKEHKVIYIASFIKGPEGAPFLPPRDVVKVVSR